MNGKTGASKVIHFWHRPQPNTGGQTACGVAGTVLDTHTIRTVADKLALVTGVRTRVTCRSCRKRIAP